jgi:hypothetical protein
MSALLDILCLSDWHLPGFGHSSSGGDVLKKVLFAQLYAAGITRFAAWWNRRRVIFLYYHGATERPARRLEDPKGLNLNHRRFAAQLDFLQRYYHVISLREYLRARGDGRSLPEEAVLRC